MIWILKHQRIAMICCFTAALCFGYKTHAAGPWGYHGIQLGSKLTQDQIMKALGADKYKKNPQFDPWNNSRGCAEKPEQQICKDADFNKYGLRAIEHEEMEIGPYCQDKGSDTFTCINPWMGALPNWSDRGHGVTKVYVFVRDGMVSSIDIKFDSLASDEFFDIAHRQFGAGWSTEHQQLYISEHGSPKKGMSFDRTIENKKTKLYSAMMTDYDEITTHVDGPMYQGLLEIKLLDQAL